MSKIRVLSDHVANQIAAGEVVERPASVAKELVENSIDAGARRVEVDVEAGGRRLLRVSDDGEGMTRDDAVLAFERHATSKINRLEDLDRITTLGFRGEALASIASVARVELVTQREGEAEGTRLRMEGGRMLDVSPAARPKGTTITVRDLFFNVPARRKFLRSEATENYHLTNLVTHYALAHPEIAFALTNGGREVLRAAPAADLRERAYQIFGAEFLDNLLEVSGGHDYVARVRGYVSAPRERRTTRDAQYLFVNGRFVRDRLISRALTEGYRSVLPHGVYPAALLFLDVPLEEVDVNVHPAKTEVRFRRAAAIADTVRDAVRAALATSGFLRLAEDAYEPEDERVAASGPQGGAREWTVGQASPQNDYEVARGEFGGESFEGQQPGGASVSPSRESTPAPLQGAMEFGHSFREEGGEVVRGAREPELALPSAWEYESEAAARGKSREAAGDQPLAGAQAYERAGVDEREGEDGGPSSAVAGTAEAQETQPPDVTSATSRPPGQSEQVMPVALPPLNSAAKLVREADVASLSSNIRPLGQLDESFIIATDPEGLLLIDQHVAHERILFDKYRRLEGSRNADSQNLLVPETFDLTPAQAAVFDEIHPELERYGFGLTRLSGRTVAMRAVPADLPAGDARNVLGELLDAVEAEKRGSARATLRDEVAASLACRAAIKINTPLTHEKMLWLIDRLLRTSSPTTCPHGRPVILRLTRRDIERGFHRP